jgi:APA family basic amino acid/polyamine antiporter
LARKIPQLSRVLGERSLASVAYGEIGSSIYFALGIVALHALGFTPWVLLIAGVLFFVVSLSYAEGTAAIPETGGAATFVRRAFNDPAGFVTGWLLFLDYLIVIALAALFVPHYVGNALGWEGILSGHWDVVAGVGVICGVGAVRLVKRAQLYTVAVLVALVAIVVQLLLIVLGLPIFWSLGALGRGVDLGTSPTWDDIAFAFPLAMLAYTGLETVANFAAETREPGRTLPRSLFAGIGAVVAASFAIAVVGITAYPAGSAADGVGTQLGGRWLRAPLEGIAVAFTGHIPDPLVEVLKLVVGASAVLVLLAAVTTSMSGAGRLAYSLARHEMIPDAFGRLNRRTLLAPWAIVASALISSGLLIAADVWGRASVNLASLYSFGVLVAFTAAQIAVVKLRFSEPGLERPFRVPWNVEVRGTPVPVLAVVGALATLATWIAAVATHDAARVAGPLWLLAGIGVFIGTRRAAGERVLEPYKPPVGDLVPEAEGVYERILVPVKLGPIGDEVIATAIRLAEERGGRINALHVIRVPLDKPLGAEMVEAEERAWESLSEAKLLASEHGVEVEGEIVRSRAIGQAVVEAAREQEADLIVMGSSPKWRRQSRFFSPTVDYVLRKADCEVMVIAYPQGAFEEDGSGP